MLVYNELKETFIKEVFNDEIVPKILEKISLIISNPNKSEIRSWNNSLQYMYKVLLDNKIPCNCGIAIEFKIPNTSKRVDFIISGKDANQNKSAIIIELKQWESSEQITNNKDGIVQTFIGGGIRELVHPSYQAGSYKQLIEDYNENVQCNKISILACAYLHNYLKIENDTILSNQYKRYLEIAPIFRKGDASKLQEFIKKNIKYGDNKEILYEIDNGKIKPSKSLQDLIGSMLKGNEEFVMIDDQKLVYETAMEMAKKSFKDSKKRVLIVNGGPGTGKSVVAINLLANLTNLNMVAQYVTKNASPRHVYAAKLSKDMKKNRITNLFKGSGVYTEATKNEFDALIVDESHRLNKKSGMFKNKGENQIKEIIHSSKFSIFFIDELQKVDMYDNGSVDEIKKFIKEANAEYKIMDLLSQFRCSGSDGYISWLDDVLQIRETANSDGFELDYDIQIFDDPNLLREKIIEKNNINNKSRILAGYCWEWPIGGRNNSFSFDISFPDKGFNMSWNLGNSATWAIDSASVNEVGCIHTSQGLEFDYVGVIIGNDLRYDGKKIITDFTKRAKTDSSIKGLKKLFIEDKTKALKLADEIIKNTYRTLMSRGQKGCYVYCEDKLLSKYLMKKSKSATSY